MLASFIAWILIISGIATAAGGLAETPFNNNPADAITGFYVDANNVAHAFLRTRKRSALMMGLRSDGDGSLRPLLTRPLV
jgi:hypothetical protein